MKITIQGQDYTAALDAAHPLVIERKLNEPSVCTLSLCVPTDNSLPAPQRNQPISITGDDGTLYFTGYLASTPLPQYAGLALEGPHYRLSVQAVSDEFLLDQAGMAPVRVNLANSAASLITSLVTRTGQAFLSTQSLSFNASVFNLEADPAAPFSRTAGAVAANARAAYRALNAALSLAQIPAAVHALNESDGSLTLTNISFSTAMQHQFANDVTVCGAHEPAAYVTEYFTGDGVTTIFNLSEIPFLPPAADRTLIRELFNEPQIDSRLWVNAASSAILSLGPGGLAMKGGNGIQGENTLTYVNNVEMGGTLLVEATGVTLATGSAGILAGLFTAGSGALDACTAGFLATPQSGTGAVTLQPVVQGQPAGSIYSINPANQYALRIRICCCEPERNLSVYRSWGDNGAITTGGQSIPAPAQVHFDLQEYVNGVGGMPIALYDGAIASAPPSCSVMPVSGATLLGTMRAFNLSNLGPNWVVTTPVGGGPIVRRLGTAAQAAECSLESPGKLVFLTGFTPAVGDQIAVRYRATRRAVGRAVNAASQQALTAAGLPPVSAWIGTVTSPQSRSSQDCRNAAQTLVQAAASQSALWRGTYKAPSATFDSDVWPGDALQLNAPSAGINTQVVARSVHLTYRASTPDLVQYSIDFANDWADDLAIRTSTAVPADAWLPAPISPTVLPNLNQLAVTSINGAAVTLNTGIAAPPGGGFEIRRRDYAFQPGTDTDLVARSSQSNLSFNRAAASDRYYLRMYDGATPPNYSEFSAALIFNLPLN